MGHIKHSVFSITMSQRTADAIVKHVRDLFAFDQCEPFIGEVIGPVVNGYKHLAIHSTGSKARWGISEAWDDCATALAAWLKTHGDDLSFPEWVWVSYGADQETSTVVMCSESSGLMDRGSYVARVTTERDAAVASVAVLKSNMGIIAMAHKDANDVMHSALSERDAAVDSARKMHESHCRQRDAFARLTAERDALQARLDDYYDDHRAVVAGQCAPDEKHCSCVPHLRREVEAMRAVVEKASEVNDTEALHEDWSGLTLALAELDAIRTRKVGE